MKCKKCKSSGDVSEVTGLCPDCALQEWAQICYDRAEPVKDLAGKIVDKKVRTDEYKRLVRSEFHTRGFTRREDGSWQELYGDARQEADVVQVIYRYHSLLRGDSHNTSYYRRA